MAEATHSAGEGIELDATDLRRDTYRGTADALIAAGLIRADQLPGGPGVNKTMRTFGPDGSEIRKGQDARRVPGALRIMKRGGRFAVEINVDEAEQERRWAMWEARREAEREQNERQRRLEQMAQWAREAGMTVEQWALRGVPMCEGDFRTRVLREVDIVERLMGMTVGQGYGYAMQPATLARLRMVFEAMRTLVREAPVSFDPLGHDREVTSLLEREGVTPRLTRPPLRLVQ